MYKYLLWDIDGTVLDFLASEAYAVRALFEKYNLGVCLDEMIKTYSRINVKYWERLERGEITKPEVLVGRFREFFKILNINPDIAPAFNLDYQTALGDHIVFVDYARETLLSEKGQFALIAITNGTKIAQTKKLRLSGLDAIFDKVFISEDVGFEKPHAEYFDYVLAHSGIANRNEALIIGDSLSSDMKGGQNSAIDTCWFNPLNKPNLTDVKVTYTIDDLRKVNVILNGVKGVKA